LDIIMNKWRLWSFNFEHDNILYTADLEKDTSIEDNPLMECGKFLLFPEVNHVKRYLNTLEYGCKDDLSTVFSSYNYGSTKALTKSGSFDFNNSILSSLNILLDMVYFLPHYEAMIKGESLTSVQQKFNRSHSIIVSLATHLFHSKNIRDFFEIDVRGIDYYPNHDKRDIAPIDFPEMNYPLSVEEVIDAWDFLSNIFTENVIIMK